MEPLAQLEGERLWLEAELLAIQRAIDDQQRNPVPEAENDQGEVVRLLTASLQERLGRLRVVNERLAGIRGAAGQL